jgi:hypothetical protein
MKFVAGKRVKYRSTWYNPGQEFEGDTRDTRMLATLGATPKKTDKPAPPPEIPRTYRRRDMRSEE